MEQANTIEQTFELLAKAMVEVIIDAFVKKQEGWDLADIGFPPVQFPPAESGDSFMLSAWGYLNYTSNVTTGPDAPMSAEQATKNLAAAMRERLGPDIKAILVNDFAWDGNILINPGTPAAEGFNGGFSGELFIERSHRE